MGKAFLSIIMGMGLFYNAGELKNLRITMQCGTSGHRKSA